MEQEGWLLYFKIPDFNDPKIATRYKYSRINVQVKYGNNEPEDVVSGFFIKQNGYPMVSTIGTSASDKVDYDQRIILYPNDKNETISIVVSISREGQRKVQREYKIMPKVFEISNPEYKIVANDQISSEAVGIVEKTIRPFQGILDSRQSFYIVNSDDYYGRYLEQRKAVGISKKELISPRFNGESEIILSHEMGHVLYRTLSKETIEKLKNLHADLKTNNLEAVFTLFKEDSYIPKEFQSTDPYESLGSPQTNSDEMYASCLNIMRRFPRQLIERFNGLSEREKNKARGIVKEVLQTAKTKNSDRLIQLIPSHSELEKMLTL